MKASDFSIHTMDIRHQIYPRDVKEVMKKAKISEQSMPNTDRPLIITPTGISGINKIIIAARKRIIEGKEISHSYHMTLCVNEDAVLGGAGIRMTPFDVKSQERIKKKLTTILRNQLRLEERNVDAGTWVIDRIDIGFDIYFHDEPDSDEVIMMRLLVKGYNPANARYGEGDLKIYRFKEDPYKFESMRFNNDGATYNVYLKERELSDKHGSPSAEQKSAAERILRIEKQCTNCLTNDLKKDRTLNALLDQDVIEHLKNKMIDDVRLIWGENDYYSDRKAQEIIKKSKCSDEVKKNRGFKVHLLSGVGLSKEYHRVVDKHIEEKQLDREEAERLSKQRIKDTLDVFSRMGIAPVYFDYYEDDQLRRDSLPCLYNILTGKRIQTKRTKHKFATVAYDKSQNRKRLKFRYYDILGETKYHTIVSVSKDDNWFYEQALIFIIKKYKEELHKTSDKEKQRVLNQKTSDILCDFYHTVTDKDLKKKIDYCIHKLRS